MFFRESSEREPTTRFYLCILAGYTLQYCLTIALFSYSVGSGLVRWPFHHARNLDMAYENILIYSPALIMALLSLFWLRVAGISIREFFILKRFSFYFYFIAGLSIVYSAYIFTDTRFSLRGLAYWPAAVCLSLMNGVAEEIFYRVTLFGLLEKVFRRSYLNNFIQGLYYALPHVLIGGSKLALLAMFYGLVLGFLRKKEESVLPCIICHFLIDIGNIGLPLLIIMRSSH
jgi:membrane protease YdiL (CAAX protease family)